MKNTLVTALLLAQIIPSFAQEEEKIVYVHTNRGPRKEREYKTVDLYNVYKFDIAQMAVGQYRFGYERRISEKSSIEFELGATLSNIGVNIGHIGNSSMYNNSKFGVVSTIAFRYYPLDEVPALNKFYVSPKLEFCNYNVGYEAADSYGNPIEGSERVGYTNRTRFLFTVGKQYWLSSTFSMDIYAGLGVGSVSETYYNVYVEYDYITQTYQEVVQKRHDTRNRVAFECGVKVGIGN